RGEFAQAEELFQRALALDPELTSVYGNIAAQRRMSSADRPWLEAVERLLAQPLAVGREIHLRYAHGKYLDDVGEYEQAFASYRRADELSKGSGRGYDRARLSALVDRLIGRCDGALVRGAHPGACDSELPVLIVGMPRSGTTLAEQILASHPAVYGAGEVSFWDRAFGRLEREGAQPDAAARVLAECGRAHMQHLGAHAGAATRVTDKMPANFLYAGLVHAALPRARIIHMRRDPLDTCLSVYFQDFFNITPYANDLEDLAHYYGEYRRLMDHWRKLL